MSSAVLVIDTNVVIAGLITSDDNSPVARILDAMLGGQIAYLLSPALLDEYRAVLLRPGIVDCHGLSEAEIDRILTDLVANGLWREPAAAQAAPDPGDNHLWELLLANRHAILVTGDRLLMDQPPDQASVITPASCLQRFL